MQLHPIIPSILAGAGVALLAVSSKSFYDSTNFKSSLTKPNQFGADGYNVKGIDIGRVTLDCNNLPVIENLTKCNYTSCSSLTLEEAKNTHPECIYTYDPNTSYNGNGGGCRMLKCKRDEYIIQSKEFCSNQQEVNDKDKSLLNGNINFDTLKHLACAGIQQSQETNAKANSNDILAKWTLGAGICTIGLSYIGIGLTLSKRQNNQDILMRPIQYINAPNTIQ